MASDGTVQEAEDGWSYECDRCGAADDGYEKETNAKRALTAHQRFQCSGGDEAVEAADADESGAGREEDEKSGRTGGSFIETGVDRLLSYVKRNCPAGHGGGRDRCGP